MPTLIINGQQVNDITLNGTDVKQISGGGNVLWQNENYRVAAPVVSCTANVVTMTCSTSGATIRYSTNGGSSWSTYSSSITISATTTYLAYATKSGMFDSEQTTYTATYTPKLPNPSVTHAWIQGSLHYPQYKIKMSKISDVSYRYYIKYSNKSAPTCSSITNPTKTSGTLVVGTGSNSEATTIQGSSTYYSSIKVIAFKDGYIESDVVCVTT